MWLPLMMVSLTGCGNHRQVSELAYWLPAASVISFLRRRQHTFVPDTKDHACDMSKLRHLSLLCAASTITCC